MTPFWAFWTTIAILFIFAIFVTSPVMTIALIWEYGGYVLVCVSLFFLFNLFNAMGLAQRDSEMFRPRPFSPKIKALPSSPKERLDPPPIRRQ